MPDYGPARADFPIGDAHAVSLDPPRAESARRDAPEPMPRIKGHGPQRLSLGDHRKRTASHQRPDLRGGERGQVRGEARDATLSAPRLLLPSIQVNVRAGREAEANGFATSDTGDDQGKGRTG